MATVTEVPETRVSLKRVDTSVRILLHNIPWALYEQLRKERANWKIRMAYDDGKLELMSPGQIHGEFEDRFRLFVVALARSLGFKFKGLGNWTLKKEKDQKAKEPDACFYIANYPRIRHKKIDLLVDPPPDIAFEAELSRSTIDTLNIYAAIGVPEIWRFDGEVLRIHERQQDGNYREVDRSLSFPYLRAGEFVAWMLKGEELDDDMDWMKQIEEWARVELVPRLGRG